MKKNFILFLVLFALLGLNAQEYKDWSKWSITLEGGLNRFDGDIQQDFNKIIPNSLNKITVGGSVEYTMTPAWSMGVDYYYLPLSALNKGTDTNPDFVIADFNSKMHNVSLFTSINFIKAFSPRTTTKWGIWGNLGLGYAWYHSIYKTDRDGTGVKDGHHQLYTDFNDEFDGRAMVFPLGLLIEYNLSKSFALGLKSQLRAFNKDYIEQRIQHGVTNDFVEMATLQLRYKFCAHRKDHTRNINSAQYAGLVTNDDIDNLQRQIGGIVVLVDPTDKLNDLDGRLRKLEDYLDIDGPDDDNDGVPNSRDQEPNTPAGNQVDFWGRTIPKGTTYDPEAFIFFDFDKTNLDEEAHRAIRIAADKLQADPDLLVEVRGFTDNMGTDTYNAGLSQRRADRVKKELVDRYGIDPNRIVANGKGKYNPEDTVMPYRPYRTAAFFYSK